MGAQVRPMHKHLQDLVFTGTRIKNGGKTKPKQLFQCSRNTLACWSHPHGGTSAAPCAQLLLVEHPMYVWGTPGWPCPWGMDTGHRMTWTPAAPATAVPQCQCGKTCLLAPRNQTPSANRGEAAAAKKEILISTTFRQAVG